jgi:Cdc6-like AAA superfamily ATPase
MNFTKKIGELITICLNRKLDMSGKATYFSKLSKHEKKVLVEKLHVTYPRIVRLRRLIDHCREHSKIAAEPECMLILGVRGSGKTTECRRYTSEFQRSVTVEGMNIPVLYTSIPSPTTTKSLPKKLLYSLGDPFWDRGSAITQTLRLVNRLDNCGTELLILDEFHNFIDGKTDRAILEVTNWLKDFLNESKKPIVIAGLPYCDIVLEANDQLERRFSVRESLHPMGWNTSKEKAEFTKFLEYIDKKLPFDERANLADDDMALRFYCATNGVIDFIMKIVRRASELAIDRNLRRLDLNVLARGYKDRLAPMDLKRPNPFVVDLETLKIKPFKESILGIMATNRRVKAKKSEPTLSELFSRQ